jgi:hypothetical protein
VYSTCIFCHAALGRNEAIEAFPVGRRLAFDADKGRLWVVCPACARWNLTPLESRWEAIEACERGFRETKLRASTGEIGLAKIREGTTLVRIGSPLLPEMAAWRYGSRFQSRRRKYIAVTAATALGAGAIIVGGPLSGVITWTGALNLFNYMNIFRGWRRSFKLPVEGEVLKLSDLQVDSAGLRPDLKQGFVLEFNHRGSKAGEKGKHRSFRHTFRDYPPTVLSGEPALRAIRHLLPRINRSGGSAHHINDGVKLLERGDTVTAMFTAAARTEEDKLSWWRRATGKTPERGALVNIQSLPKPTRLALEMAVHETDERRAMEGELAALEERWREAEEIAAIADDLFLPKSVRDSMERLKG